MAPVVRVGEKRSERVAAGLATVAAVAAAPPQGGGAGSGEISDGGGSSGSGECDAAGAEAEEVAVAEVRKWKRVRGTLWGLVSWEPDPVLGEFPLEWKAERDLGAHWVARGRALTRAAGRVRAGAGRAAGAVGGVEAEAARRAARIAAEVLSASRLVEEAAARERRALARGGGQSAGVKRCSGDAAGGEAAGPRTRVSQGAGASGVKRACGVGSPEGATVAAREAEEAEASRSRARSARVRRLRLDGAVGE